jgi:uncharacterized protein YggL (DUF469 family)
MSSPHSWERYLSFGPLLAEVMKIDGYRTKYGLGKLTGKDQQVVRNWLKGGKPQDTATIATLVRAAIEGGSDLHGVQTFAPIWDVTDNVVENDPLPPPELKWITSMSRPPEVGQNIRGLFDVDGLVGIGSSPLMGSAAWANRMQELHFGMSTFKSRRAVAREPAIPPHLLYVDQKLNLARYDWHKPPVVYVTRDRTHAARGPVPDIVTSIGGASRGMESWAADYEQVQRHPRGRRFVGLSIIGDGSTQDAVLSSFLDGVSFARGLRPPFIELSPSCHSLENSYAHKVEFLVKLCRASKKALVGSGIPLFLKLAYTEPGLLELILLQTGSYANGVVLNNSLPVRPVSRDGNGKEYQPFPGREVAGLSGPSLFDLTISSVRKAVEIRNREKLDLAIIASGGVTSVDQIKQVVSSGADLLFVTTAAIYDPLLAIKARFGMAKLETAPPTFDGLLRTPRDAEERQAARELKVAIAEFQRRGFPLDYWTIEGTWHDWLDSREQEMRGLARRPSALPKKDDWVLLLHNKGNKS